MTQSSFPFDGLTTSESQFSYLFRELIDTGVIGTGNELVVSADASGMNVKVQPGSAAVRGFFYQSTAVEPLTIAAAGAVARTDTVVLRLDPTANTIVLAVTSAALVQTDTGIYELPLATVAVGANVVTIQVANVSDVRRRSGSRVGYWPTTALLPASPRKGQFGFNGQTSRWVTWDGAAWVDAFSWSTLPGKPTSGLLDGRDILSGTAVPDGSVGKVGDFFFVRRAA